MYSTRSNLILAFHGCDKKLRDAVSSGATNLIQSSNDYDWLGHGVYFCENSHKRALEFATLLKKNPSKAKVKINTPSVLGAVICLGNCLDLIESESLQLLKEGYEILHDTSQKTGFPLPQNKTTKTSKDLLLRNLDCAVIETLHKYREDNKNVPYDSVRGVFFEGKDLYDNAGFKEKNHIQICIRNPNCIKGYFIPRSEDEKFHVL